MANIWKFNYKENCENKLSENKQKKIISKIRKENLKLGHITKKTRTIPNKKFQNNKNSKIKIPYRFSNSNVKLFIVHISTILIVSIIFSR